jgi:hypothetical protein
VTRKSLESSYARVIRGDSDTAEATANVARRRGKPQLPLCVLQALAAYLSIRGPPTRTRAGETTSSTVTAQEQGPFHRPLKHWQCRAKSNLQKRTPERRGRRPPAAGRRPLRLPVAGTGSGLTLRPEVTSVKTRLGEQTRTIIMMALARWNSSTGTRRAQPKLSPKAPAASDSDSESVHSTSESSKSVEVCRRTVDTQCNLPVPVGSSRLVKVPVLNQGYQGVSGSIRNQDQGWGYQGSLISGSRVKSGSGQLQPRAATGVPEYASRRLFL